MEEREQAGGEYWEGFGGGLEEMGWLGMEICGEVDIGEGAWERLGV